MKQKFVATVLLCNHNVDIYAMVDEQGGEFYFAPDKKSLPRIKIGLNYPKWNHVVEVALHEILEYAACVNNLRFQNCTKWNGDNGNYLFVMDHPQFATIVSEAGDVLATILPLLAGHYNSRNKLK